MKFGVRKPSIKRSIKARTTGRIKRTVKKTVNPLYGKKGMGYINNPQKAVYNKVYNKTTIGVRDIVDYSSKAPKTQYSSNGSVNTNSNNQNGCLGTILGYIFIFIGLFTLPIGFLFIFIGALFLIIKKSKGPEEASQEYQEQNDSLYREVQTNTNVSVLTYSVEKHLAPNYTIDYIDFNKFVDDASKPFTWSNYEISGIKTTTNRKNKRHYDAISKKHIEILANNENLTNIEIISVNPTETASEYQIDTANEMGITITKEMASRDAKEIINRIKKSEDVVNEEHITGDMVKQYVKPMRIPTEDFARFAFDRGIIFSAYISESSLIWYVINNLDQRNKLAFYAYCVSCDKNIERIGNMDKSPLYNTFFGFADWAEKSETLARSLDGREVSDYLKPNKRTNIYKAVADYLATN